MKILGYKAWLSDGTSIKVNEFISLPETGIIILMTYYDELYDSIHNYRSVMDGCDWYYFDGNVKGVRSLDGIDVWQIKPEGIEDDLIKQGEWINTELFDSLSIVADKDLIY